MHTEDSDSREIYETVIRERNYLNSEKSIHVKCS